MKWVWKSSARLLRWILPSRTGLEYPGYPLFFHFKICQGTIEAKTVVNHGCHLHSRQMGGSYSGGGILRHQAILRIDSKHRSRMDINFRIRLAFPKAFSADHYFKKIPYPIISENFFHNSQTVGRSQGQPKALFLQLPKDIRRLLPEDFRKSIDG